MVVVWLQLIDVLSSLLERPVIKKDFEPNYQVIMQQLNAELNNVKRLYDEQMTVYIETGTMPIHKNMAPVSGSLKWSQELRDRITIPMNEFRRLEHPYVSIIASFLVFFVDFDNRISHNANGNHLDLDLAAEFRAEPRNFHVSAELCGI